MLSLTLLIAANVLLMLAVKLLFPGPTIIISPPPPLWSPPRSQSLLSESDIEIPMSNHHGEVVKLAPDATFALKTSRTGLITASFVAHHHLLQHQDYCIRGLYLVDYLHRLRNFPKVDDDSFIPCLPPRGSLVFVRGLPPPPTYITYRLHD